MTGSFDGALRDAEQRDAQLQAFARAQDEKYATENAKKAELLAALGPQAAARVTGRSLPIYGEVGNRREVTNEARSLGSGWCIRGGGQRSVVLTSQGGFYDGQVTRMRDYRGTLSKLVGARNFVGPCIGRSDKPFSHEVALDSNGRLVIECWEGESRDFMLFDRWLAEAILAFNAAGGHTPDL